MPLMHVTQYECLFSQEWKAGIRVVTRVGLVPFEGAFFYFTEKEGKGNAGKAEKHQRRSIESHRSG